MKSEHLQYCIDKSLASKSNFTAAFKMLPEERQAALYAFYTICREVDDIADNEFANLHDKKRALDAWRLEIDECYAGNPSHPATHIFYEASKRYEIPQQHLVDLMDGVCMDLSVNRYETFAALYRYCFGVASAVGMVCTYIFGCKNKQSLDYAEALGLAFQLTNIVRDVKTDLTSDRIYLPLEDFKSFGYSEEDLRQGVMNQQFEQLMFFQYQRAVSYYEKARRLMPDSDKQALLPSRLMSSYYRAILERIRMKKFDVFNGKISLPKFVKASLIAIYLPQMAAKKWQKNT